MRSRLLLGILLPVPELVAQGPGIGDDLRQRLLQPFAAGGGTGDPRIGSGLGLAIGQQIAQSLGGHIALDNRSDDDRVVGLDAHVRLPLTDNRG